MAYTESNMLPLGTKAPNFTLPDTISAKEITLYEMPPAKATLIMFLCNHCPYVIHVNPEIVRITADYKNGTLLNTILDTLRNHYFYATLRLRKHIKNQGLSPITKYSIAKLNIVSR
jgi:hypothetical protein